MHTALETVPGWEEPQISRLKKSWIDTAEQVVALANTPDGMNALANQIGTTKEEAQRLIEAARSSLAPVERAELEKEVDPSQFGLGALSPR